MARLVKRVLLAPIVIVIATTVVPPATAIGSPGSPLSGWLAKNVPPTLTTVTSLSGWITNGVPPRNPIGSITTDKLEEKLVIASLGAPATPSKTPAPELKNPSAAGPSEKPIFASLSAILPVSDTRTAAADPLSAEDIADMKIDGAAGSAETQGAEAQAEETQAEEKQGHASLGSPAAAADMPAPAIGPLPVEELKIASEGEREEKQAEDKQVHASLGLPAAVSDATRHDGVNFPQAKQFPSNADNAPAERRASLGPTTMRSDARNANPEPAYVPPEKTRVAYDAPPVAEQPKSIGKREYVDDTVYTGLGSPEALLEALRYMGANAKTLGLPPTLWCADFMNMVLRKIGIEATGSRAARSYLKYGQKIDGPRVGAIAIFTRGGPNSGHLGIVRGTDGEGNPIIVSGNHNNRVAEAVYPKSRVLAYVVPRETPR